MRRSVVDGVACQGHVRFPDGSHNRPCRSMSPRFRCGPSHACPDRATCHVSNPFTFGRFRPCYVLRITPTSASSTSPLDTAWWMVGGFEISLRWTDGFFLFRGVLGMGTGTSKERSRSKGPFPNEGSDAFLHYLLLRFIQTKGGTCVEPLWCGVPGGRHAKEMSTPWRRVLDHHHHRCRRCPPGPRKERLRGLPSLHVLARPIETRPPSNPTVPFDRSRRVSRSTRTLNPLQRHRVWSLFFLEKGSIGSPTSQRIRRPHDTHTC